MNELERGRVRDGNNGVWGRSRMVIKFWWGEGGENFEERNALPIIS
jgi:hypothetical protein